MGVKYKALAVGRHAAVDALLHAERRAGRALPLVYAKVKETRFLVFDACRFSSLGSQWAAVGLDTTRIGIPKLVVFDLCCGCESHC